MKTFREFLNEQTLTTAQKNELVDKLVDELDDKWKKPHTGPSTEYTIGDNITFVFNSNKTVDYQGDAVIGFDFKDLNSALKDIEDLITTYPKRFIPQKDVRQYNLDLSHGLSVSWEPFKKARRGWAIDHYDNIGYITIKLGVNPHKR